MGNHILKEFILVKDKLGKPDFENESFRAWIPSKTNPEEYEDENTFEIKIGEFTYKNLGFTIARDKTTSKKLFAFKIKSKSRMILYHIFEDLTEEEKKKADNALMIATNEVNQVLRHMGTPQFALVPVIDTINNVMSETKALEKLAKKKKNES